MVKTNTRELSGTYTDCTPGMQSVHVHVFLSNVHVQAVCIAAQTAAVYRSRQNGHEVLASSDKGEELREQETWCSSLTDEPGVSLSQSCQ